MVGQDMLKEEYKRYFYSKCNVGWLAKKSLPIYVVFIVVTVIQ
jgi:hypothetical protein